VIEDDYNAAREGWHRVLDQAHQRATLSAAVGVSKKFKAINQGIWHQIEVRCPRRTGPVGPFKSADATAGYPQASLSDRERGLKRLHRPWEQSEFIGKAATMTAQGVDAGALDYESFDDPELYQHLLKEAMEGAGLR
jgi:hypothetical protein